MRTDPEPEFEPATEALPERGYRALLPPAEEETEPAPEADNTPPPADEPEVAATDQEVDGCDHPLIPARAGQWRDYHWELEPDGFEADTRIQAVRTIQLQNGEREVLWRVRMTSDQSEEPLAQITLRTRCAPGDDSEDPWFGIIERGIGHQLTRRTRRWRWPAELGRGVSFRGTATLDPSQADARRPDGVEGEHALVVTRNHIVDERVDVEVPAGTYAAWRIAYEEEHAFGTHGETGTGTYWVAEGVGLVRNRAENSTGSIQTVELVRVGGEPED